MTYSFSSVSNARRRIKSWTVILWEVQKVIEFMVQECDKKKEITEFIEKCRFGDKLVKNSRNETKD